METHTTWYGDQTRLAVDNFPISGRPFPLAGVRALVRVKRAAAPVNAADGIIDAATADAIVAAADEILASTHDDQFPVDVFQTGSGTSTNMNVNEVLANLATARSGTEVHPNDDVNASQSSNDTVPTAIRIAALEAVVGNLLPALATLEATLADRATAFADVVKAGRTHLMDATPITVGQEFSGYRQQVADSSARLRSALDRVGALPLGGTATGNGVNASPTFAPAVIQRLRDDTGLPFREAPDHFAVQGAQDAIVELSGHLRTTAMALFKVANDIRLLASGPRTGLGELRLPSLQPGSSIMPGKVNPVLCETVTQVAARVFGNDATVGFAGSQGQLELNTFLPVLADAVLESIALLASAAEVFARRCVAGIEADVDRCRAHAEATLAVGAALNPLVGYDAAAAIVGQALREGRSVREVAAERDDIEPSALDDALDLLRLATGN